MIPLERLLTGGSAVAAAATLLAALVSTPASAAQPTGTRPAGTLQAWGNNRSGDLGDGTTANSDVPVPVKLPAGTKVVMARAGRDHSLALTSAGHVLAWGGNRLGQLGDGSTMSQSTPVAVRISPRTRITAVRAGCTDSLALTSTGQLLAWGDNQFGELGNGTRHSSDVPVRVRLPRGTTVKAISAGCFFNLALTTAGKVLAWGRNYDGSLGDGRLNASSLVPVRVRLPAAVSVTAIGAGGYFGMAVTSGGQLYSWGYNGTYQLGDGTTVNRDTPVRVALRARFGRVTEVACGFSHTLALTSRGIVLGWGYDGLGQLGNWTGDVHQAVRIPRPVPMPPGITVRSVAAGFDQSFALTAAGQALAWGFNESGQLGIGSFITTGTPSPVMLASGTIAVALGAGPVAMHGFAVTVTAG